MSDSLPALRHRIKTADDLRSVVKTMKAMAAASISQFEQAALALEDYRRTVDLSLALSFRQHPPRSRPDLEATSGTNPPRSALLVFGTDQGMVGQFNESLVRDIAARLEDRPEPPLLWVVGERASYRLADAGFPVARLFATPGSIEAVAPLVTDILQEIEATWTAGEADAVEFCHHRPLSRTNYEMRWERLLPLDHDWESRLLALPWPTNSLPELVHDHETVLPSFISQFLFVSLFKACTESAAAENGARLSAMQRAEKNIDERLREFRLAFNRQRQKAIDEELFDLIAGFEALNGKSHPKPRR